MGAELERIPMAVQFSFQVEATDDLVTLTTNVRDTLQRCYSALHELIAATVEDESSLNVVIVEETGKKVVQEIFKRYEPLAFKSMAVSAGHEVGRNQLIFVYTCDVDLQVQTLYDSNDGLQNLQ